MKGRNGGRNVAFRIFFYNNEDGTRQKGRLSMNKLSLAQVYVIERPWITPTQRKSSNRDRDTEETKPLQPRVESKLQNVCPLPTPCIRRPPEQGTTSETGQASPETKGKRSFFEHWSRCVLFN